MNRKRDKLLQGGSLLAVLLLASCMATDPVLTRNAQCGTGHRQELQLSNEVWEAECAAVPPPANPALATIVTAVGQHLVATVQEARGYHWQFRLLGGTAVNAFALPGGQVAVYEGIFLKVRDEAELAAVMAHVIAHVLERHGEQRMNAEELVEQGHGLLASALDYAGATRNDVWHAAWTGIARAGFLLPFSREQEYTADRLSMILMAYAGYDPRAALNFWERNAVMPQTTQSDPLFSVHPSNASRVLQIRRALPEALEIYEVSARRGRGVVFTLHTKQAECGLEP